MPSRPFFAATLTAALLAPALAPAWPDGNDELAKRLKIATQEFTQKKEQARSQAVKDFTAAITRVKSAPGLTPAARTDRIRELEAAKKRFTDSGRFPEDDEFAAIELKYYLAVNKAFDPLARLANSVIDDGIKTNNKELEESGLKLRASLQKQLPGNKLEASSVWHGTLHRPNGATIPYHLFVGRMGEGGLFKGHVEDNAGVPGNWAYDISGQVSGLGVEFALTKSTRGDFSDVRALGIVSGDRLIAEIVHAVKGKAGKKMLIVLKRVR
jgi:hypothetical protein